MWHSFPPTLDVQPHPLFPKRSHFILIKSNNKTNTQKNREVLTLKDGKFSPLLFNSFISSNAFSPNIFHQQMKTGKFQQKKLNLNNKICSTNQEEKLHCATQMFCF